MIRVVTDSASDLPPAVAERHGIEVVPLTVRFGLRELVDGVDVSHRSFWERLRESDSLPETAAPSAGRFYDTFRRLHEEGADGVLAVCMSSDLSATYQSAVIAAEKAVDEIPVRVVDSRMVSMALGLQAIEAALVAREERSLEEVAAAALAASASSNVYAALDTLEFLRRGGRIGGVEAFLGGMLDVKPIISFRDGVVAPEGRVRTRARARAAVLGRVRELAPRIRHLAVVHSAAPDLDGFLDEIQGLVPEREVLVAELGPVVATHSGPGAIGIAYVLG